MNTFFMYIVTCRKPSAREHRLKAGREGNDGEEVGNGEYVSGNVSRRQRREEELREERKG